MNERWMVGRSVWRRRRLRGGTCIREVGAVRREVRSHITLRAICTMKLVWLKFLMLEHAGVCGVLKLRSIRPWRG